jgi:hypothetical protein
MTVEDGRRGGDGRKALKNHLVDCGGWMGEDVDVVVGVSKCVAVRSPASICGVRSTMIEARSKYLERLGAGDDGVHAIVMSGLTHSPPQHACSMLTRVCWRQEFESRM